MQWQDVDVRRQGALDEQLARMTDLRSTGEEGEDVAVDVDEGLRHRRRDGRRQHAWTGGLTVLDRDGVPAPLGGHDRSRSVLAAEQPCDPVPVEGRRGDHQLQLGAQGPTDLQRERQAEVRLEVAFVELVEHHQPRPGQLGVPLQAAQDHAFGHHLDAGAATRAALVTGRQPDRGADVLTELDRELAGGSPGRDATGFEHHDPAGALVVEQRERDAGRLPGSRWGLQDRDPALVQRCPQRRQDRVDRQGGGRRER
jgi:hypothetical protein